MAKIGDLFVQIGADIGAFQRELKKLGKDVENLGRDFKKVGTTLTQSITAPLAGFAAAALASSEQARTAFSNFATQTTAIMGRLGDTMFRVLNIQGLLDSISGALDSLVSAFEGLPDPIKAVALAIGGVAAAAGPLIFVAGQLLTTFAALSKAGLTLATVFSAHPLLLLVGGVAAAAAALGVFAFGSQAAAARQREFTGEVKASASSISEAQRKLQEFDERYAQLQERLRVQKDLQKTGFVIPQPQLPSGLSGGFGGSFRDASAEAKRLAEAIGKTEAELAKMDRAQFQAALSAAVSASAQRDYNDSIAIAKKEYALGGDKAEFLKQKIAELTEQKKKLLPVLEEEDPALRNIQERINEATAALKGLNEETQKQKDLEEAFRGLANGMREIALAQELGVPGVNAVNEELRQQLEIMNALDAANMRNTQGWEVARQRVEELQSPVAQLAGHIQETQITLSDLVISTFDQISQGIGNALAQIIVFGGKGSEIFKQLGKQILATVISTLAQMLIQYIIHSIITLAVTAGQIAGSMAGYAALTYAAAFSSIAAIPFGVGPLLAPAGAKAAVAAMLAGAAGSAPAGAAVGAAVTLGGGVAGAAEGGIFSHPDITAIAERGPEIVLNKRNIQEFGLTGERPRERRPILVQMILDRRVIGEVAAEEIPDYLRLHGINY